MRFLFFIILYISCKDTIIKNPETNPNTTNEPTKNKKSTLKISSKNSITSKSKNSTNSKLNNYTPFSTNSKSKNSTNSKSTNSTNSKLKDSTNSKLKDSTNSKSTNSTNSKSKNSTNSRSTNSTTSKLKNPISVTPTINQKKQIQPSYIENLQNEVTRIRKNGNGDLYTPEEIVHWSIGKLNRTIQANKHRDKNLLEAKKFKINLSATMSNKELDIEVKKTKNLKERAHEIRDILGLSDEIYNNGSMLELRNYIDLHNGDSKVQSAHRINIINSFLIIPKDTKSNVVFFTKKYLQYFSTSKLVEMISERDKNILEIQDNYKLLSKPPYKTGEFNNKSQEDLKKLVERIKKILFIREIIPKIDLESLHKKTDEEIVEIEDDISYIKNNFSDEIIRFKIKILQDPTKLKAIVSKRKDLKSKVINIQPRIANIKNIDNSLLENYITFINEENDFNLSQELDNLTILNNIYEIAIKNLTSNRTIYIKAFKNNNILNKLFTKKNLIFFSNKENLRNLRVKDFTFDAKKTTNLQSYKTIQQLFKKLSSIDPSKISMEDKFTVNTAIQYRAYPWKKAQRIYGSDT